MKTNRILLVAAFMAVLALVACQREEVEPQPQPQPAPQPVEEHNMFYGTVWFNRNEGTRSGIHYVFLDELTFATDSTGEWHTDYEINSDHAVREYSFVYSFDTATSLMNLAYYDNIDINDSVFMTFFYNEDEDVLEYMGEGGFTLYRKE